jgi:hypothetical protein
VVEQDFAIPPIISTKVKMRTTGETISKLFSGEKITDSGRFQNLAPVYEPEMRITTRKPDETKNFETCAKRLSNFSRIC